jgi:small-conductance mechanosensitive channel
MAGVPDMAGWLQDHLGLSFDIQQRLLATIVVLLVVRGGRRALMRAVDRHVKADEAIHAWRRGSFYVMWTLLVIVLLRLWIDGLSGVGTFLGLLVAGIAVALNQPLQSVAAWTYIVARRPFSIGDRIEVGSRMGEVVDIRLFSTLLYEVRGPLDAEQSTGRIVHVPNKMMLEFTLINASRGLGMLWHEVPVLITFESDWEKAKDIVEGITRHESERYELKARERARKAVREVLIKPGSLGPRVYLTVRDSGVLLTARYLVDVRDRRESDDRVWTALLRAFGEEDTIDMAYPTSRTFVNHIEGKQGAKAPKWPPAPKAYLSDLSEDGPDSR